MTASRLDERLAALFCLTRSRAGALIREGRVCVNGQPVVKCGQKTHETDTIELIDPPRYVSRGGEKLAAALDVFGIDPTDLRVLDLGISTGGFTDCLLQAGAESVVGVDVGHGQLAASLRADSRVRLYEGINARELRQALPQYLTQPFDLITIDLSFISLRYIVPELAAFLAVRGRCIALLKPQFEVGRDRLGAGGVVRDPALHLEVKEMLKSLVCDHGLVFRNEIESPILGTEGNREFLVLLERAEAD